MGYKMLKLLFITMSIIASLQSYAKESDSYAGDLTILKVETDTSKKLTIVKIKLNTTPPWKQLYLESHDGFLQITMPHLKVAKPGIFYEGQGKTIKKIAAYQKDKNKAIFRLFVSKKSDLVRDHSDIDILGNQIVVSIDESNLALISKPSQSASITTKSNDVETPALDNKLVMSAYIFLATCIFILIFLTLSRIRRGLTFKNKDEINTKMKIISNLALGPKQRLSLVQIGTQKLLISISPDQINLLTQIDEEKKKPIAQQKRASERMPQKVLKSPVRRETPQITAHHVDDIKPPKPITKTKQRPKKIVEEKSKHRINVKIDDHGVSPNIEEPPDHSHAVNDITQLIRDKLKSLPSL